MLITINFEFLFRYFLSGINYDIFFIQSIIFKIY